MDLLNENALREKLTASLERDRNPEAVISAILNILINEPGSEFYLKNTFIIVKEELITYFYGQSISAELLFQKMWRHKNRLIQLMSTFLIPVFFKPAHFQELRAIIPHLRSLADLQITRLVGYNLAQVLKRKPALAVSLLRILTFSNNVWERILALHLAEELNSGQHPEISAYLKSVKMDSDLLLQKYKPVHFKTDEEVLNSIQLNNGW